MQAKVSSRIFLLKNDRLSLLEVELGIFAFNFIYLEVDISCWLVDWEGNTGRRLGAKPWTGIVVWETNMPFWRTLG